MQVCRSITFRESVIRTRGRSCTDSMTGCFIIFDENRFLPTCLASRRPGSGWPTKDARTHHGGGLRGMAWAVTFMLIGEGADMLATAIGNEPLREWIG